MLLANEVFADLVKLLFRFKLDPLSFLDGLGKALASGLLTSGKLSFLLLDVAKLRVEDIVLLALLVLQLSQILLEFSMSLLSELSLEHQTTLGRLIEEICTIG